MTESNAFKSFQKFTLLIKKRIYDLIMKKYILNSLSALVVVLTNANHAYSCSPAMPDPLSSHKPFTFKFTNMKFTPHTEALKAFASEDQIVVLGDPGISFIYLEPRDIGGDSKPVGVKYNKKTYRPIDYSGYSNRYACFSRLENLIELESEESLKKVEKNYLFIKVS